MTDAQYEALQELAHRPEIWWHDVPAGSRKVIQRKGWLREVRPMKCGSPGHRHPGYVTISASGLKALELEKSLRKLITSRRRA